MKKDLSIIGGLFVLILLLLVFGKGFTSVGFLGQESTPSANIFQSKNFTVVNVNDLTVNAKLLTDNKSRSKGLSGVDSLPLNEGMLFVFDKSAIYTFWMKDVKFSIDIIWIDKDKKVVHIVESALVEESKKDSELQMYRPNEQAKYVLEVNAGLLKLHNIKIGDAVNFEL
jgi:uncharacterized protein